MKRTLAIPKPCAVECFLGRGDQRGMIREAEIIIRAEIDHAPAVGDRIWAFCGLVMIRSVL